jgi:hypothetical protein
VTVSTVFLQALPEFETMVFVDGDGKDSEKTATRQAALEAHRRAVEKWLA